MSRARAKLRSRGRTAAALAVGALLAAFTASVPPVTGGPTSASPASASPASASPASAGPGASLSLTGHGFGHGRGMGQWGALGYALQGESYGWILDHYYGGTTSGQTSNRPIRVVMSENDGNDVTVTSSSPFTVASYAFAAGQAARMRLLPSGQFQLDGGTGCQAATWTALGVLSPADAVAVPADGGPAAGSGAVLDLCQPVFNVALRGDIEASSYQGSPRTVNVVTLESYLRGVVPAESPSSWGTLGGPGPQGQPAGFQALEAQAVAARSYAVSGLGQYGYADICDSQGCQVYLGMAAETSTSDAAVAATAGDVRLLGSGTVAQTEYSSSTGGYSAGGTFPAVVDDGDAVCTASACNPNHAWSTSVPVAAIQAAWPAIGALQAVDVTSRNGLGDLGGRVTGLNLVGSSGQVTLTGAAFADAVGLKSDWFAVQAQPGSTGSGGSPGSGSPGSGSSGRGRLVSGLAGYRVADLSGQVFNFGAANNHGSLAGRTLNAPLVGVAGSPDGAGYWLVASDGGVFSFGTAGFHGSAGNIRLRQPVVGMAPTPDGGGYWLVASDGGVFSFGDAAFHGSAGNIRLRQPVVGMAPTPDGGGYWLVASDGGVFSFGDAAFHGSAGNLGLSVPVAGMASTPSGEGYWLVDGLGGIFTFGDAAYLGSLPSQGVHATTAGMLADPSGGGYLVLTRAGVVRSFGDAPALGDVAASVSHYTGPTIGIIGIRTG